MVSRYLGWSGKSSVELVQEAREFNLAVGGRWYVLAFVDDGGHVLYHSLCASEAVHHYLGSYGLGGNFVLAAAAEDGGPLTKGEAEWARGKLMER